MANMEWELLQHVSAARVGTVLTRSAEFHLAGFLAISVLTTLFSRPR